MSSKLQIVGFDLDSTMCDTEHRHGMIKRNDPNMDWGKYSLACVNDSPGPALPLAQMLSSIEFPFIVLSARSEIARPQTLEWLSAHDVKPWHVYLEDERHHHMAAGSATGHAEWKALRLKEIQDELNVEFLFYVEDHSTVAVELSKIGIPCILVHGVNKLSEFLG